MPLGNEVDMKVDTRYFGEVEISDDKIIHFENGLFGFEEYKDFTILYDVDSGEESFFSWLQCVTEKDLAFPVVNPQKIDADYDPVVEDALLESIGAWEPEELVLLLMVTAPADVKKTSVNKKAPLIINASTCKGVQIVAENADYEVKHYLIPQD